MCKHSYLCLCVYSCISVFHALPLCTGDIAFSWKVVWHLNVWHYQQWVGSVRPACVGGSGEGGREGFPLSHKADGEDLCGCSQSQQGQVYPAMVWKWKDSFPCPLRIPPLACKKPKAKPQTSICRQHKWCIVKPQNPDWWENRHVFLWGIKKNWSLSIGGQLGAGKKRC